MIVPPNLTHHDYNTLLRVGLNQQQNDEILWGTFVNAPSSWRQLTSSDLEKEQRISIDVSMENFTQEELKLQLNISAPLEVSKYVEVDRLILEVLEP